MEKFDNEEWYSVQEVSKLTDKKPRTILHLILYGNQLNKLPARQIGVQYWIAKSDIHTFQFVSSGRYGPMHAYRFDEKWNKVPVSAELSTHPKTKKWRPEDELPIY
jgi:hypothetical protein